mmetsp:Transcript_33321/g.95221  ORF Transcript_33321/g.95221 Transcript_33321/m.95221 type:complete len:294 (+) Transcript_33321:1382-2263(+)
MARAGPGLRLGPHLGGERLQLGDPLRVLLPDRRAQVHRLHGLSLQRLLQLRDPAEVLLLGQLEGADLRLQLHPAPYLAVDVRLGDALLRHARSRLGIAELGAKLGDDGLQALAALLGPAGAPLQLRGPRGRGLLAAREGALQLREALLLRDDHLRELLCVRRVLQQLLGLKGARLALPHEDGHARLELRDLGGVPCRHVLELLHVLGGHPVVSDHLLQVGDLPGLLLLPGPHRSNGRLQLVRVHRVPHGHVLQLLDRLGVRRARGRVAQGGSRARARGDWRQGALVLVHHRHR